jgi:hypothetical protein
MKDGPNGQRPFDSLCMTTWTKTPAQSAMPDFRAWKISSFYSEFLHIPVADYFLDSIMPRTTS